MESRFRGILILMFFTCVAVSQVECCREGWLPFDKECIKFYAEEEYDTIGAVFKCGSETSFVASVTSEDMLQFLAVHLHSYSHIPFWIRNNSSFEYFGEGPCHFYKDGKIEVASSCTLRQGIICSAKSTLHHPTENCLIGLTEHSFIGDVSGNCVYRTHAATNRDNAVAQCAVSGGTFMDMDGVMRDGIFAFFEHGVMVNDGVKYWTDRLRMNGSTLMWKTGEPFLEAQQSFIRFEPGKGGCVTVSYNLNVTIKIVVYQTDCRDHAYVLCSTPPSSLFVSTTTEPVLQPSLQQQTLSCPVGNNWKVYRGDCFWETSFETSRLSWNDSRNYCLALGGDLASFHNIDEEKIGLSFQYGGHPHPYWIGLRLDLETETYKWSDGTPLDYLNWAEGHPDHRDKRLQCVSMDAQATRWMSSLCYINSWFICRVPKRPNPPTPVFPTLTPLPTCQSESGTKQYYFRGYCYNIVNNLFSWHRAKNYCENRGSSLVSIHSDEEIGLLLRMLYDDKNTKGTRVWIGLNTLRSGILQWTDFSPLDFTYWNGNKSTALRNVEKCYSMYIGNGFWNDENCNEPMGFVCKQVLNATVAHEIPTTPDPRVGNCKKGWYDLHDRCYLPVGYTERERVNWTVASTVCESKGGGLVSIRNHVEQAFVSLLMQELHSDVWIGLHDTIHSGRYYWLDNSDIQYTNWAPGEPSFFGIQEDCVKMVYNDINSGVWQDDVCSRKLSFICYAQKDPSIPKPNYNRGLNCIHPEGWLKLDNMCFELYGGNPATWEEADAVCRRKDAHLISLSEQSVQAVATYLGTEVNQTYWIGLKYKQATGRFEWLNGLPVSMTKWGKYQPSRITDDDACFASTPDGYWARKSCDEELPFMCQIGGKASILKEYAGNCPKTSKQWIPTKGSYCYLFETSRADWFGANIRCFRHGSYLISIHSFEDLEMIRKGMKPEIRSLFIGLMRNEKEGFSWTDNSPVDFVNWDEGQPENERDYCVEMMADTLKWRVAPCHAVKNFICSTTKDLLIKNGPRNSKYVSESSSSLSTAALIGILVCSFVALLVIIGIIFFFRPSLGRSTLRSTFFRQQSVSYENALYNVDSACMEFQDDVNEGL